MTSEKLRAAELLTSAVPDSFRASGLGPTTHLWECELLASSTPGAFAVAPSRFRLVPFLLVLSGIHVDTGLRGRLRRFVRERGNKPRSFTIGCLTHSTDRLRHSRQSPGYATFYVQLDGLW